MNITYKEAAKLLKTNVETIKGYMMGSPTVIHTFREMPPSFRQEEKT